MTLRTMSSGTGAKSICYELWTTAAHNFQNGLATNLEYMHRDVRVYGTLEAVQCGK